VIEGPIKSAPGASLLTTSAATSHAPRNDAIAALRFAGGSQTLAPQPGALGSMKRHEFGSLKTSNPIAAPPLALTAPSTAKDIVSRQSA